MVLFVKEGEDISALEATVKNKWKWSWLEEINEDKQPLKLWCKKIDTPGVCYCVACKRTIVYGTSGKKTLLRHANEKSHCSLVSTLQKNTLIDGASSTIATTLSVGDKVAELKAVLSSFIAEHCLPFSLTPDLIQLCRRLTEGDNQKALSSLSMGRTCASYTTTFGVAHAFMEEVNEKMHKTVFSLNIDEATNAANDKIVNVMAQYFDDDYNKILLEHLGSRIVNIATAANIFAAVSDILKERGLKWEQTVSCLFDNCNVMRGIKGGVETLARQANQNLLDIGGETVHLVHNAASHFFAVMEKEFLPLQALASDLFYDIEDSSPKASSLFQEVQRLLGTKERKLMRPIANR